ncbi:hypothetical protein GCM10009629_40380 [Pseudonocardia alni]
MKNAPSTRQAPPSHTQWAAVASNLRDRDATTAAEHWWRPPSTTSTPTEVADSPPTTGPAWPCTGGCAVEPDGAVGVLGSADPHGAADPSPTTRAPCGASEVHVASATAAVTVAAIATVITAVVCAVRHLLLVMGQARPSFFEHAGQAE